MANEQTPEQALATLWQEVAQGHFLRGSTTAEALAALERRREVVGLLLRLEAAQPAPGSGAIPLMLDHFSTLLKAESVWMERALSSMRVSAASRSQH